MAKAVDMVADGTAPKEPQSEKGASYDPMLNKPELQNIDWKKTGNELHNFIRGMDSVPGASCKLKVPSSDVYQDVLVFGSCIWRKDKPNGKPVEIEGTEPGIIHEDGLLLKGSDGVFVNVKRVKINGKMKNASTIDQVSQQVQIDYTEEENELLQKVKDAWNNILSVETEEETDFFASGAGSMDVVRLVEEVKDFFKVELQNEDVFLNPTFSEFCLALVLRSRGANCQTEINYRAVEIEANGRKLRFPCQLFIDGQFIDAENGKTIPSINPHDENVICEVRYLPIPLSKTSYANCYRCL